MIILLATMLLTVEKEKYHSEIELMENAQLRPDIRS